MPPPKRHILCVDDNEDARYMLATLLAMEGYEVATAPDTDAALQLAAARTFDLYILDSLFPKGSGLELCQQLRAYNPAAQVVFYSAAAYLQDHKAALAAGACAYVDKPDVNKLVTTIHSLLGAQ